MKKRKSRSNRLFYSIVSLGFVLLLGFFYVVSCIDFSAIHTVNTKAFAFSLGSVYEFPTPTPKETPTPTAYPTPENYGYCLNVPVLMYHHTMPWGIAVEKSQTALDVDSDVFDQQIGFLASNGYTFIFAEDLVHALRDHTLLPPKSIVITLDDGYDDVYNYAFPTLKKYNAKATVMVPTGLLGNNSGANSYYNWGQLGDMVHSGLVSVGNHTWSHFPMGSQTPEKDLYEVSTAQKELNQLLGKNPDVFAYPYGTNATLGRLHDFLQQNGFAGAFSTIGGTTQCDSFIFSLHRTRIGSIPFPAFGIY